MLKYLSNTYHYYIIYTDNVSILKCIIKEATTPVVDVFFLACITS